MAFFKKKETNKVEEIIERINSLSDEEFSVIADRLTSIVEEKSEDNNDTGKEGDNVEITLENVRNAYEKLSDEDKQAFMQSVGDDNSEAGTDTEDTEAETEETTDGAEEESGESAETEETEEHTEEAEGTEDSGNNDLVARINNLTEKVNSLVEKVNSLSSNDGKKSKEADETAKKELSRIESIYS